MKSFLLHNHAPIIKWGLLSDETYFEGKVPEGYDLAVCPSDNIIILDVDVKNGKNGYEFIPDYIIWQLEDTFHYDTKSGGGHYWIEYTGNKILANKATKYGLDLRVGATDYSAGGYVRYQHNVDIRECKHLIKKSSNELNEWLESLFVSSYIKK